MPWALISQKYTVVPWLRKLRSMLDKYILCGETIKVCITLLGRKERHRVFYGVLCLKQFLQIRWEKPSLSPVHRQRTQQC